MSLLQRLRVRDLRNLRNVDIELGSGLSLLQGPNAAGKTALLEAVYLLSRGRSFRGRRLGPLVTYGERNASVEGWLERSGAIERIRWESQPIAGAVAATGHRAGTAVNRDRTFLVRLVCDATHSLVEGEPSIRRRFVDWNVFHVEPQFGEWRGRFRRVASQRNAWLRAGGRGPAVWDRAYAELMRDIETARERFAGGLRDSFRSLTAEIGWFDGLRLEWRSGVGDVADCLARLEASRSVDRRRGFTSWGLSRDDLVIMAGTHRWAGSRGETKIVGVLLQVAAQRLVESMGGVRALWLVDDLSAELADVASDRLLEVVRARASQVLMTALPGRVPTSAKSLFHVERGAVRCRLASAAITDARGHDQRAPSTGSGSGNA